MVLVVSDDTDISTNDVIKWLYFYKKKVLRINGGKKVTLISFRLTSQGCEFSFKYQGKTYFSDEITAVWYRRGVISPESFIDFDNILLPTAQSRIQTLIQEDKKVIVNFLHYFFEQKRSIGSFQIGNGNKLLNLHIAAQCGLKIPETLVTSDKKTAQNFIHQNAQNAQETISKSLSLIPGISYPNKDYNIGTALIEQKDLEAVHPSFAPSLLQNRIEKLFELRVFYLHGKCYSMAIFSQLDQQTQLDFRNYNDDSPNRSVPYQLPPTIENKLSSFMNKVNMNCGSIDLIYNINKEYIFLEVNPVGQFGMVSYPCNYQLEKLIASYL